MEFWGTEVAPGKPQVNSPGDETYCHVSQAALGPSKDGKSERVVIRVETGGKNVVLGTLVSGKVDQMALDLIFDREFKLSHTSTSSSVFFCGYKTEMEGEEGEDFTSDEESDEGEAKEDDEDVPTAVPIKENGTVTVKEGGKAAKKLAKVIEQVAEAKPKKADSLKTGLIDHEALEGSSDDEDEDEDEDEDDDDDEGAEGAMHSNVKMDFDSDDEEDSEFEVDDEIDSDEDEDEESDELDEEDSDEDDEADDEEEDKAAELGKKRALISSSQKSPVGGKKPRLDTPAKPGLITTPGKKAKGASDTKFTPVSSGKKSGAKGAVTKTPQKTPAKEAVTPKTPKTSTPDSAKKLGGHSCGTCNKSFTTESGLSQHNAAKHKT